MRIRFDDALDLRNTVIKIFVSPRMRHLLSSPDGVDECELHEGPEYESSADNEPNLCCLDVGDFGQGTAGVASQGDERQHSARACKIGP